MASSTLKYTALIAGSLILGSIMSIAAYRYFYSEPNRDTPAPQREILFWYDPMSPNTHFDKPGKSPFMDMDLVPKYADEKGESTQAGIKIDPTQIQNLGVKTDKVQLGRLTYSQTLPANVSFNEYQFAIVQSRADGFVEKVYPLTIGDKVKKGAPLLELTIPEWVAAQSEYLLLNSTGGSATELRGVLERIRLAGMPEQDIQRLKSTHQLQTRFILRAPIDGVITAFDLRSGMNISKDKVVAQIQGMDPVWISAAVPESIAFLMKDSTQFTLSVPAFPQKTFTVQQWSVLPSADKSTRTLQIRLQVDNKDEALKPGMNAYLTFSSHSEKMLLIPSQAVIDTGGEQRVITLDSSGRFVPKTIRVLQQSQRLTGIGAGLAEGELVVVNGLFLIDSEANISGALQRMRQSDAAGDSADHADSVNHTNDVISFNDISPAGPVSPAHSHAGRQGDGND